MTLTEVERAGRHPSRERKALAETGPLATPPPRTSSSNWPTRTSSPTAAQALDKERSPRSNMFHLFGVAAPVGAIVLSILIGGDPGARFTFWIGASIVAILQHRARLSDEQRRAALRRDVDRRLWSVSTLGVQPAVYYFGPFSAVIMVDILGIVFIALGRVRWAARATAAICIGSHLVLAIPIIVGATDDVGVLTSAATGRTQLIIAELLIVAFLVSGYALGRWARQASAAALSELQSAMRVIGDQQQALAEVVDEQARQKVNEGRWSGQHMGSYKLGFVLGRGAMGEVYEATGDSGRMAAVKLLNVRATASPGIVERFHREMDVAARLESPNIVQVFEVSPPDAPVPYIAMERLHGTDLATRLRNENRLPSDELVVLLDHRRGKSRGRALIRPCVEQLLDLRRDRQLFAAFDEAHLDGFDRRHPRRRGWRRTRALRRERVVSPRGDSFGLGRLGVLPPRSIDGRGSPPAGSTPEWECGSIDGPGLPAAGSTPEWECGSIDGPGLPPAGSTPEGECGSIDGRGLPPAVSTPEWGAARSTVGARPGGNLPQIGAARSPSVTRPGAFEIVSSNTPTSVSMRRPAST